MTYPNILILDYMQTTGHANPELQIQAEKYVGTGYQRLLTFEADGGGFSLFGRGRAQAFLSAYGLMLLSDMNDVYPVDQALIERTANWLLAQQQADGTWQTDDYRAGVGALGPTAYVTWALIEAGYRDSREVAQAIVYILESALLVMDAYSLAMAANALAAYDPQHTTPRALADFLYKVRIQDGDTVYWQMGDVSFMGATGETGSVETTALAAQALLRARAHSDAVQGALAYLIQGKDAWGTWRTTQATILSLKALLLASEQQTRSEGPASVSISLNHELTQEITIDETNADVVHLVTFDQGFSPGGGDEIQIELTGGGNLMYQVATHYYLPWNQVFPSRPQMEFMTIDVDYNRTALQVNDKVTVDVGVRLNQKGMVKMALIDLGVPPGFTVLTEDLSKLVEEDLIARYELTGRQIIIYLEDYSFETPLYFSYLLRARLPRRAHTPASLAYHY